jgi:AcrR family transcriptional regulator
MKTEVQTSAARPDLRDRQRQHTRDVIFEGVMTVLSRGEITDLSFAAIARAAGISERTIYRHYPDLEALLDAFWPWFVESLGLSRYASTAQDLASNPPHVFSVFDEHSGLIRALIASKVGRAARDRGNPERQAAFHAAIEDVAGEKIPQADMRVLAAGVYAVYSGYGWASMRDFWNIQGKEAGDIAAKSMRWMIEGYMAERKRQKSAARNE